MIASEIFFTPIEGEKREEWLWNRLLRENEDGFQRFAQVAVDLVRNMPKITGIRALRNVSILVGHDMSLYEAKFTYEHVEKGVRYELLVRMQTAVAGGNLDEIRFALDAYDGWRRKGGANRG